MSKKYYVFHTHNFLDFQRVGDDFPHAEMEIPRRPVACVHLPSNMSTYKALDVVFESTNTIDEPWALLKNNHYVTMTVRSTSTGDVIVESEDGKLLKVWVVLDIGFKPYEGPRTDWYPLDAITVSEKEKIKKMVSDLKNLLG